MITSVCVTCTATAVFWRALNYPGTIGGFIPGLAARYYRWRVRCLERQIAALEKEPR